MNAETQSILEEALQIVNGERAEAYGDPYEMCKRISKLWEPILLGPSAKRSISPAQVAMCLIQLKIARECNSPRRDSRVDIAGYAEILDRVTRAAETDSPNPEPTAAEPKWKAGDRAMWLEIEVVIRSDGGLAEAASEYRYVADKKGHATLVHTSTLTPIPSSED